CSEHSPIFFGHALTDRCFMRAVTQGLTCSICSMAPTLAHSRPKVVSVIGVVGMRQRPCKRIHHNLRCKSCRFIWRWGYIVPETGKFFFWIHGKYLYQN